MRLHKRVHSRRQEQLHSQRCVRRKQLPRKWSVRLQTRSHNAEWPLHSESEQPMPCEYVLQWRFVRMQPWLRTRLVRQMQLRQLLPAKQPKKPERGVPMPFGIHRNQAGSVQPMRERSSDHRWRVHLHMRSQRAIQCASEEVRVQAQLRVH